MFPFSSISRVIRKIKKNPLNKEETPNLVPIGDGGGEGSPEPHMAGEDGRQTVEQCPHLQGEQCGEHGINIVCCATCLPWPG